MKLIRFLAAFAAAATSSLLLAAPASAQATRTWISGVGDDVNPCSRISPCKTFAGAIAKTQTGGEIDCVDQGSFGAVTITKAITLDCKSAGGVGYILTAGTSAITVNIPSGDNHVQIIGLALNGGPVGSNSLNGVNVVSGANVLIADCFIYQYQNIDGINGNGVRIAGAGAKVTIENTRIRENTNGVVLAASGIQAVINQSMLDGSLTANLVVQTAGSNVFLNRSVLINTPTAISNAGGTVFTTVTNFIRGTGAPNSTAAQQ